MARVVCTLPNASELINGVKFASHKMGMISEEISEEIADAFAEVKGFLIADRKGKVIDPPAEPDEAGDTGASGAGSGDPGASPPAA